MAIASKWLGATFNKPGFDLFDFNVYALAGTVESEVKCFLQLNPTPYTHLPQLRRRLLSRGRAG